MSSPDIWNLLVSATKLDRDKGVLKLQESLKNGCQEDDLSSKIVEFPIVDEEIPWEMKLGVLLGAQVFVLSEKCDDRYCKSFCPSALVLLDYDDVRVRHAAGDLLGCLCRKFGPSVYERSCEKVLELFKSNLEKPELADSEHHVQPERGQGSYGFSARQQFPEPREIFKEATPWRDLETAVTCLEAMIAGCGTHFAPYLQQDLIDLALRAMQHNNRFVRQSGFHLCSSLIEAAADDVYSKFGIDFANYLANGLGDSWGQVRLMATRAVRPYLLNGQDGERKDQLLAILAPRICLNRYYHAEGVRRLSQDTWVRITLKDSGKKIVEKYIDQTVDYYRSCAKSSNDEIREAACQCIAELARKIDGNVLQPYIDSLIESVLSCFKDDAWPVRDMACLASGTLILSYPEAARKSVPVLIDLFFRNLRDPISTVRQGGAVSLANLLKSYGKEEIWPTISPRIVEGLKAISEQPEDSPEPKSGCCSADFSTESNESNFPDGQELYSCAGLASQMMRVRRCRCQEQCILRPSEPWEFTDGCVYFIFEISDFPDFRSEIVNVLLPLVISGCKYRHFSQHYVFFETVTKTLPGIAKKLGKRTFKPLLEEFFDAIFYACESDSPIMANSGKRCLKELANLLGPNILRGRVEQYHTKFVPIVDAVLDEFQEPFVAGPGFQAGSMPISIPVQTTQTLGGTPTGSPHH